MEMVRCYRNPLAGRDSVDEVDLCYRWGDHYLWSFEKKHWPNISSYFGISFIVSNWTSAVCHLAVTPGSHLFSWAVLFVCQLCMLYYKERPCRERSCKRCNLLGDLFCSQLLAHSIPWVQLYCGHILYAFTCYTFYKPLNIIWLSKFGAKLTLLTAIFYSGCGE
jgi:hypothetical protein